MCSAIFFNPHTVFHLPLLSFTKPRIRISVFSLKENTNGPKRELQLTFSSIRCDGNKKGRPRQRNSASEIPQPDDDKFSSTNKDEIIALFRRIQTSISKGESVVTKKRSSKSSQDASSSATAESVLDVLRQSTNQVKDKTSKEEGNIVLARQGALPKEEHKLEDNESVVDIKSTRPPSSFVKRSPISYTAPRESSFEVGSDASLSTIANDVELINVGELKLTELKELAKSRGLKGYSRLKKSELVELLNS